MGEPADETDIVHAMHHPDGRVEIWTRDEEIERLRAELDGYRVELPPGVDAGDFLRDVNALVQAARELNACWADDGLLEIDGGQLGVYVEALHEALKPFEGG